MIAIYTGVTGLTAHQQAVDVIANNIANVDTTGYKSGRANFQAALSQTLQAASYGTGSSGSTNPVQVGLGVEVGSIDNIMTQGDLESTGNTLDVAINGNGFFVLGDSTGQYVTRSGVFSLNDAGQLVSTATGMTVLGWQADPSTGVLPNSESITNDSSITIPIGVMSIAQATQNVSYEANLDASAAVGDTVDTSVYVYDSLGNQHEVDITFTKTADNTWSWAASSPDADPNVAGSSGTLEFTADGQIINSSFDLSLSLLDTGGATSPLNCTLSCAGITQLSGDSDVQAVSQDGVEKGTLESVSIDSEGVITGAFSNGLSRTIGQIALARFANEAGLTAVGNSLWQASAASGPTATVRPGTAGTGTLSSGYLEQSNVDLASEFADLIVTQRGFQASSRVITTADEMLQDLLTLKR